MNILIIAPFSALEGGANRAMLMVIDELKMKFNHNIVVIVPDEGPLCKELDNRSIHWIKYRYHEITGIRVNSIKNLIRFIRFEYYEILDYFRAKSVLHEIKQQFDVVYINDVTPYFGAYLAMMLKIPFVWHFRSYINPDEKYTFIIQKAHKLCSKFITISSAMSDLLKANESYPSERIIMINDGSPVLDLKRSRQSRSDGFHIVQCGRISPEKGHIDAIKAIGTLRNKGITDIFLHIVGRDFTEGKNGYISRLKSLIDELGVTDQVIFEGTVNNMPVFRADMNCELMCSVSEPFGLVTLEGMKSGLFVIGSNTGGTRDIIIDNYNGLFYEQGNFHDLASKILKAYIDPNYVQRICDNAFEYGNTHFTVQENGSRVNDVLEAVKLEGI